MAKINFSKLNIKLNKDTNTIKFNDTDIEVLQRLPIEDKIKFAEFVIQNAIDDNNSTFSTFRTEVYFIIGMVKYYTNITFTDKQLADVTKLYDLLDGSGLADMVYEAIPVDEIEYMRTAIDETEDDIAKYASSMAGMIKNMNTETTALGEEVTTILNAIKNGEGMEQLAAIKDAMGKVD